GRGRPGQRRANRDRRRAWILRCPSRPRHTWSSATAAMSAAPPARPRVHFVELWADVASRAVDQSERCESRGRWTTRKFVHGFRTLCQNCAKTIDKHWPSSVDIGTRGRGEVGRSQHTASDGDTWFRRCASIQLPIRVVERDGGGESGGVGLIEPPIGSASTPPLAYAPERPCRLAKKVLR